MGKHTESERIHQRRVALVAAAGATMLLGLGAPTANADDGNAAGAASGSDAKTRPGDAIRNALTGSRPSTTGPTTRAALSPTVGGLGINRGTMGSGNIGSGANDVDSPRSFGINLFGIGNENTRTAVQTIRNGVGNFGTNLTVAGNGNGQATLPENTGAGTNTIDGSHNIGNLFSVMGSGNRALSAHQAVTGDRNIASTLVGAGNDNIGSGYNGVVGNDNLSTVLGFIGDDNINAAYQSIEGNRNVVTFANLAGSGTGNSITTVRGDRNWFGNATFQGSRNASNSTIGGNRNLASNLVATGDANQESGETNIDGDGNLVSNLAFIGNNNTNSGVANLSRDSFFLPYTNRFFGTNFALIGNGLNLLGVDTTYQQTILGLLIFAAVAADQVFRRKSA